MGEPARGGGHRHAVARTVVVAAGAAAGALSVRTIWQADPHLVRTASGAALVRTVRGPDGSPVRVLRQGGVYQSATYLDERRFEPVFTYIRGFDAMFEAEGAMRAEQGHGVRRVLMLGGGGFSYPKHLLTSRSGARFDVVEPDPAITSAARRWFFVDELEQRLADPACSRGCSLGVFTADGRGFLEAAALRAVRYDAIINDAFAGREPVHALASVDAARAVKACLVSGGLYLVNVVSRDHGADLSFLRDEVATLRAVFARVHVLDTSDEQFGGESNYLVIATDAPYRFSEAIPYDDDFPGNVLSD